MKNALFTRFLPLILLLGTTAFVGFGQVNPPANAAKMPADDTAVPKRGDLLRELNLSRDQLLQIRRINSTRKPLMETAQGKLRMANRFLDEAIYSDQMNEQDFQDRLKAFQQAQAEVARIRFTNELAVRKILTPEQLSRFRNMRRKFEERRSGGPAAQNVNNRVAPFRPNMRPVRKTPKF